MDYLNRLWPSAVATLFWAALSMGGYMSASGAGFLMALALFLFVWGIVGLPSVRRRLPAVSRWFLHSQPKLADHEASGAYFSGRVIRLVDMAGADAKIKGKTFERCVIRGPAVIVPTGTSVFQNNRMERNPIIRLDAKQEKIFGAIEVVDCSFRECEFSFVGITGQPALLEKFERDFS